MQGKSEPEYATTDTALSKCLVDGDAVTRVRDRRRRREALGISFVIESVVLALLIVAPLMTSVAQPQLNRIFPPMPVVMGIGNLTIQAGTLCHTRFATTLLFCTRIFNRGC